jgi:hypothetical protein
MGKLKKFFFPNIKIDYLEYNVAQVFLKQAAEMRRDVGFRENP